MTEAGWEQRLENLARAQERADGLRDAVRRWFHDEICVHEDENTDPWGGITCDDRADALLSGPLAPLLEAQAAVERLEALAEEFNAPVRNGSIPGQTALFGGGDVAYRIRRALAGSS